MNIKEPVDSEYISSLETILAKVNSCKVVSNLSRIVDKTISKYYKYLQSISTYYKPLTGVGAMVITSQQKFLVRLWYEVRLSLAQVNPYRYYHKAPPIGVFSQSNELDAKL